MCTYCGCETEPAIAALAHDHDRMAELASRVTRALVAGDQALAGDLTAELRQLFEEHVATVELGLFRQLTDAGEGVDEVAGLKADHCLLKALIADAADSTRPDAWASLVSRLSEHANTVDTDLCPFAVQVLPDERWVDLSATQP
jgi:hypothetical protein